MPARRLLVRPGCFAARRRRLAVRRRTARTSNGELKPSVRRHLASRGEGLMDAFVRRIIQPNEDKGGKPAEVPFAL